MEIPTLSQTGRNGVPTSLGTYLCSDTTESDNVSVIDLPLFPPIAWGTGPSEIFFSKSRAPHLLT